MHVFWWFVKVVSGRGKSMCACVCWYKWQSEIWWSCGLPTDEDWIYHYTFHPPSCLYFIVCVSQGLHVWNTRGYQIYGPKLFSYKMLMKLYIWRQISVFRVHAGSEKLWKVVKKVPFFQALKICEFLISLIQKKLSYPIDSQPPSTSPNIINKTNNQQ